MDSPEIMRVKTRAQYSVIMGNEEFYLQQFHAGGHLNYDAFVLSYRVFCLFKCCLDVSHCDGH